MHRVSLPSFKRKCTVAVLMRRFLLLAGKTHHAAVAVKMVSTVCSPKAAAVAKDGVRLQMFQARSRARRHFHHTNPAGAFSFVLRHLICGAAKV
jgi:hypothetical protein